MTIEDFVKGVNGFYISIGAGFGYGYSYASLNGEAPSCIERKINWKTAKVAALYAVLGYLPQWAVNGTSLNPFSIVGGAVGFSIGSFMGAHYWGKRHPNRPVFSEDQEINISKKIDIIKKQSIDNPGLIDSAKEDLQTYLKSIVQPNCILPPERVNERLRQIIEETDTFIAMALAVKSLVAGPGQIVQCSTSGSTGTSGVMYSFAKDHYHCADVELALENGLPFNLEDSVQKGSVEILERPEGVLGPNLFNIVQDLSKEKRIIVLGCGNCDDPLLHTAMMNLYVAESLNRLRKKAAN